jgi:hypothetical protein
MLLEVSLVKLIVAVTPVYGLNVIVFVADVPAHPRETAVSVYVMDSVKYIVTGPLTLVSAETAAESDVKLPVSPGIVVDPIEYIPFNCPNAVALKHTIDSRSIERFFMNVPSKQVSG